MNLNGKVSNPGELRIPISLQVPTLSQDGGGAQKPSWATLANVLSRWQNVHGGEVWQSQAVEAVEAATVLIRYRSSVTQACSILKDGMRFEIVSIDDVMERHEYMELKVKRVKGSL
jgi:SPP1 family predicted phage head-tail adaptor